VNLVGGVDGASSALNLLLQDIGTATSPAGLASSMASDPNTTSSAGRWFFPSGWTDRNVYTSVDDITIKVSVTTGSPNDPGHDKTQTEYINEIVTSTVDSVNGTATHETVVDQAVSSDGPPIAATSTPTPGVLTESVTVSDHRTTTETSYASKMPTKAEVDSNGEPVSTVHTEAVATLGSVAEKLSASKPVAVAEVDDATIAQTLNELATYISKNANLSQLLQGPYAPTFVNTSA
jgi:hypothetical protein